MMNWDELVAHVQRELVLGAAGVLLSAVIGGLWLAWDWQKKKR